MPGQVAHFYLAARLALEKLDGAKSNPTVQDIKGGFQDWLDLNIELNSELQRALQMKRAGNHHHDDVADAAVTAYTNALATVDRIAIFSAFATGAMGPDLWTIPDSLADALASKTAGEWWFDMGHYNLSHLFPRYTLQQIRAQVSSNQLSGIQLKYQTAYILGYLSHIALDILAHTKVNVFAGAYHLMTKIWELEHSWIWLDKFNNHNKVEQFLDAFIRYYCYEGWYAHPEFNDIRINSFKQTQPWGFPNYREYYEPLGIDLSNYGQKLLDASTSLAGAFTHRYYSDGDDQVTPFIRQYCWDAHENLTDSWLRADRTKSLSNVPDELQKVKFFRIIDEEWWEDIDDNLTQYTYLNTAIPNLERTNNFVLNFFEPAAFGEFIQGSMLIADDFITKAVNYLDSGDTTVFNDIQNWNLDTGFAYRLKELPAPAAGSAPSLEQKPICLELYSVMDYPALQSWKIPELDHTNWQGSKAEFTWQPQPSTSQDAHTTANKAIPNVAAGTKTKALLIPSLGIELRIKNTCFHKGDEDSEIRALIYGINTKSNEAWVIHEENTDHDATPGFLMKPLADDFKDNNDFRKVEDGTALSRKAKTYSSVFLGNPAPLTLDKDTVLLNGRLRFLPRHVKVTTCRQWVATAAKTFTADGDIDETESNNFNPSLLKLFNNAYPAEDMLFSIFVLLKTETAPGSQQFSYLDVFHRVEFSEANVADLKMIKVIGANSIVLVFVLTDGQYKLDGAWIDGDKQEPVKDDVKPKPPQPKPPYTKPPDECYKAEFEDVLFRTDSAVLLPADYDDGGTLNPGQQQMKGLKVLAALHKHLAKHTDHKLIVTAHTDTVGSTKYNLDLSLDRADSIALLLEGKRTAWAEIANRRNHKKDIQTILTWMAAQFSWNCDPKGVDGKHGQGTLDAIAHFKEKHNEQAEFTEKVTVNTLLNQAAWEAIFDVYQREIAKLTGTDYQSMESYYTKIRECWVSGNHATGCSEAFPKENPGVDKYESPVNRRVEIYLFNADFIKDKEPLCSAARKADTAQAEVRLKTCQDTCWIFRDMPKPQYIQDA